MTTPNDAAEPSLASAGCQPVAWAVRQPDSYSVFASRMLAEKMQELCAGGEIAPLYSQPTLTDEEREALAKGIYLCEGAAGEANENINAHAWAQVAARLRGLLERQGGER